MQNLYALIVSCLFFLIVLPASGQDQKEQYASYAEIAKYCQHYEPRFTVYDVSRLEEAFGISGSDKTLDNLNNFFSDFQHAFELHTERTREEALDFLHTTDSLLKIYFYHKEGFFLNRLVSDVYPGISCYQRTLIYNSLAKLYPFEVYPVLASDDHIFIRIKIKTEDCFVNWETNTGLSRPDAYYMKKYQLSPQAIENGCYLRNLNDSEAMAPLYRYMAFCTYKTNSNIDELHAFMLHSYKQDSLCLGIARALAWAHALKSDYDAAFSMIHKTFQLDSMNIGNYYTLGLIYERKGNFNSARDCYHKILKHEPDHAASLYRLGIIAIEGQEEERFDKILKRLKELDWKGVIYHYNLEEEWKIKNTKDG